MKKLILLIVVCILSISVVKAENLNYEYLPYYVKIKDEVIQVKKVYDNNGDAVFNVNHFYYNADGDFNKYQEGSRENYGNFYSKLSYFNTIVHYGYNQSKDDFTYFITQVLIWRYIDIYTVEITDSKGNIIEDYDDDIYPISINITNHNSNNDFFGKTYTSEIWDTTTFDYKKDIILNNPVIDGLNIQNDGTKLSIYNELVNNYKVEFYKNYEQINYSYNDGRNIYWQSFGGPANLTNYIYYNVVGLKLNIKENLIGVNNRIGDAKTNSNYELYLDDELKLNITNLDNNYIKSNSSYTLKDKSEDIGIYYNEDISFNSLDEDLEVTIDKYVISKNISVDILDDNTYYVYLKSNNELYEEINAETELITLPYGIYYISDNNDYYEELEVLNNNDENLVIDNSNKEDDKVEDKEDQEDKDNTSNDDILVEDKEEDEGSENNTPSTPKDENDNTNEDNTSKEDTIVDNLDKEDTNGMDEEETPVDDSIIENPKTLDNIFFYLMLFIISLSAIIIGIYYVLGKKKSRN